MSSTHLLQNLGGFKKVDIAPSSTFSITKFAIMTEIGEPLGHQIFDDKIYHENRNMHYNDTNLMPSQYQSGSS